MRNTMLALAAAAFLACALNAMGAIVAKEDTVVYKIDRALSAGRIDPDEALMYRFWALNPDSMKHVPEEFRAEYYAPEPVSGTPVWLELVDRWPTMRPDVKRRIIDVFGGDPVNGGYSDGGTRFRPLQGFSTYSNYGGYRVYHYDSQPRDGGENFRIHWVMEGTHRLQDPSDPNGNGVPEVVEYYAADAETAWKAFTEHKWFYHPDDHDQAFLPLKDYYPAIEWPPDEEWDYGGNDRWDIYLGQFTQNVLGMTTGDPFEFTETYRDDRPPYFMDRNKYDGPMGQYPERITVAHELGHGVEYMIDVAESSASGTPRWYFEATATWMEEEVYPGNPEAIGRASGYLGNPLRSLKNPGDGGYQCVIINYFINDWQERYWTPPGWKTRPDRWIVRDVWRALAKGDEWYTDDPTVNRESTDAMGYLATYYQNNPPYLDGRAFKEIFEYWTTWNWLTGARDDGQHYKYGNRFTTVVPQNTWGPNDYPIVNYEPPTESYYMNFWGHGFYLFNQPPAWSGVTISFEGDPDNAEATKDWGGQVYVTRNGSTWTNLAGEAGVASAMYTPEDKGIILIRNPNQYQAIVATFCNVADEGERLPFKYSFIPATDLTAPNVAGAVALTQTNPDYIRVLIGSDEELFGKPESEILFTSTQTQLTRKELVPMTASPSGRSFMGTFLLDLGDRGSGTMKYRAADKAGNFVSGEKNFSAAYLASHGGSMGDAAATLKLSAGTVAKPTLFLITPRTETSTAAPHAVASALPGDGNVETLGTVYDFAPSWARLAKPVEVALSYEGLEVREDYLSVYQWTGNGWTDLGGAIDKRSHRVTATANSLGAFVLGYGELKGNRPPSGTPKAFGLYQNYPNPAHEATVIKYALPEAAEVELAVYDLSGRRVATVVRESKAAGVYEAHYGLSDDTGRALPAGVYLYRLTAGTEFATKKLVVGTR